MKKKVLYMCGVTYEHELGDTRVEFFESVKELKANRTCWKECGIVKVTLDAKYIRKQHPKYTF